MRKYVVLTLFLSILSLIVFSQRQYSSFAIRSNNQSLLLKINGDDVSNIIYSDYGKVVSSIGNARYLFGGQELDQDLNIYMYPSRIYGMKCLRFFQPDPKSQYHSPYLFVGADPVNYIDHDGKEGKPLVLYSQESRSEAAGVKSAAATDMEAEVDAYYAPISDFVNGDVFGDFSEWNGNVFIESHITDNDVIVPESYYKGESIQLEKENISKISKTRGQVDVEVNMDKFGKQLGDFSFRQNVPIKNITVGGCQGGKAAEKLGSGVALANKENSFGGEFFARGLKPGNYSVFMGESTVADLLLYPHSKISCPVMDDMPEKMNFYINKGERSSTDRMLMKEENPRVINDISGAESPIIRGEQFNDLVNGRVPTSVEGEFETFRFARVPY